MGEREFGEGSFGRKAGVARAVLGRWELVKAVLRRRMG